MTIYNLNYLPSKDKIFIFDTNILLYLNSVYTKKKCFEAYSNISNFLIQNNCKIYVDTLVLNEFVNKFINNKLEIAKTIKNYKFDKKVDRNTENYNCCLNSLKIIFNNLQSSYNIEWASNSVNLFTKLNIVNYLDEFNRMEFSDWTIKETAKNIGAILITNDGDFKNCNDVDVFTI